MKKIILSAAMLGFAAASFAGSPKSAVLTPKIDDPTATMYYFPITPAGSDFVSRSVPVSSTTPSCDGISGPYCEVGLTLGQVDIVGGNAIAKSTVNTADGSRTHRD